MSKIKCPNCPVCGVEPMPMAIPLGQSFCPNDDCNVLAWDPYSTKDENLFDGEYAKINGEVPPKVG